MDAQARALLRLAGGQHGVVTRDQLRRLGWGRGRIEHALRSGRLHRLYRGVYAVGRPDLTDRRRWLGGVLACGERTVLSHRSAAALWRVRPWPSRLVEVSARRSLGGTGLLVHRSTVAAWERVVVDRLPVTTLARTLIDLAEVVSADELERAIHQAHRLRRFDAADVNRIITAHPGRNGAARLRRAMSDQPPGTDRTRSWLEVTMLALCRQHGFPLPEVNVSLVGRERDFHWPDHNLVVEVDGRDEHLTPRAFEADHERDVELAEAGYHVRRFTHRQLTPRPVWVAGRISAAL